LDVPEVGPLNQNGERFFAKVGGDYGRQTGECRARQFPKRPEKTEFTLNWREANTLRTGRVKVVKSLRGDWDRFFSFSGELDLNPIYEQPIER
jgi:hypothetical protein